MYAVNQDFSISIARVWPPFFRRWAHAPTIHAASHVDHEKRVACFFFISMLARGSVPIVMLCSA